MTPHIPPEFLAPTADERRRIADLIGKKWGVFAHFDVDAPVPLPFDTHVFHLLMGHLEDQSDGAWKQRTIAAWAVGVMEIPPGERSRVISLLRNVLKDKRGITVANSISRLGVAYARAFGVIYICIVSLILIFAAFANCGGPIGLPGLVFGSAFVSAFLSFWAIPIALPLSVSRDRERNQEARAMAAKSLLRLNAMEALPELLEGACAQTRKVATPCRMALRRMLPHVTEEHLVWMPLNAEELLSKLLMDFHRLEGDLGEIILNYLAAFGNGSSLRAVELYARKLAAYAPYPEEVQLQQKAEATAVLLRERLAASNARQELLRHSVHPTAQADELLRPAADTETTPAEQLLRPVENDE